MCLEGSTPQKRSRDQGIIRKHRPPLRKYSLKKKLVNKIRKAHKYDFTGGTELVSA